MNPHRRAPRSRFLAGTAALIASRWVGAQSGWPNKPATIVAPIPAGGGTDAFAQPLTGILTRNTGKQFLNDNRGGSGAALQDLIAEQADMMFDGLDADTLNLHGNASGRFVNSEIKRRAGLATHSGATLE